MKRVLSAVLLLMLTRAAYAALPGDFAEGKRLHDANCTGCHDSGVYTRKNRQVRSLDALKDQLQSCGHMVKKEFTAAQAQDLTKYLNDRFYRFQ